MSLDPTVEEQELLAGTLEREHKQMTARERISGMVAGGGFILAAAGLWVLHPPGAFPIGTALLCAVVLVAATTVSFDTPFGFTVLTQVAFVPLLFAVPPTLAPIVVAVALALSKLPGLLRGEIPVVRLLGVPANCWFALGPAAVFAISGTAPRHADAGLLAIALAAEFAVDFAVSSLRYTFSRQASLRLQLRESWVYGIDAALSGIGLVVAATMQTHPGAVLALLPLLGLFAVLSRERRQRLESLVELNNAYRGTALVLGDVVEADDGYTGEHCKGVVALSIAVGERLGLSAAQRRNLEFAALLHDVGKIAVPKEIVNKPGKLSPEEWTIIKTHSAEGQRMLSRVGGFMREVGLIVRSHHERWDGGGYPDGLAGEEIPLEARIIACCDTWNAMRTNRSYRRALSREVALTELRAIAGGQLDPTVVDALCVIVENEVDEVDGTVAVHIAHSQLLEQPAAAP